MSSAQRYVEAQHLFVHLLASAPANTPVPACPRWAVHDLVAHQVHQLRSATEGTFPTRDALDAITAPSRARRADALHRQEAWIARGVQALRRTTVAELTTDWSQLVIDAPARALEGLFPDVTVHLFDLLGAVGSAAYRDHAVVVPALEFWARYAAAGVQRETGRTLRLDLVEADDGRVFIGDSDADVRVAGTPFELLRTLTGRRSLQQAESLRWRSANAAVIACVSLYGWRTRDLDE
jgi:uncharacterized protein (TIGR03083 family)